MKRGKKYIEASKLIERGNLYDKEEAIALVKKSATAKFDETIEVHIRTGCDGRHADQQIRGAVVLPHGTGKKVRILVFAKDAKAEEAKAAGADYVGAEDLIPRIQNENWFDYDVVVATPDMMGVVGRLGRVLGPVSYTHLSFLRFRHMVRRRFSTIIRLRLKRQVLIRHPSRHGRIWKRQPKRCRKGKRSMDGSRCGVMQI